MSTVTDTGSVPLTPEDTSKGSSVSSGFINEYEEILKFAVVAPKLQIMGNGYTDVDKRLQIKNKNRDGSFDTTSSTSSSSSSSSTSPAPFESGKAIQDGNLEIKVIEAKKAVNKVYKVKEMDRSRQQQMSNAMETLLETPKDVTSTIRRRVDTSGSTPGDVAEDIPSPSIDKDLMRMDSAMDDWCLQLKRNVLNELADMKKKQLLYQEQKLDQMKAKFNAESIHASHEVESMKELLYTFEQSVKQKDEVITNLTAMLNKQKERCDKIRIFSVWKLKHNDQQSQVFTLKMADKFHKRALMGRVWAGWRSVVENTWKRRVEKACQIKSQEICLKLTEDYEERLQALQQELAASRAEVAKMHTERDCYEENMKKAFMRGVCALNMEAMSMFKENPDSETEGHTVEPPLQERQQQQFSQQVERNDGRSNYSHSSTTASYPQPNDATSSSTFNTNGTKKKVRFDSNLSNDLNNKHRPSLSASLSHPGQLNQRKNIHVKMTGKKDYGALKKHGGSQSSTISSIKVERHHSQPTPLQQQQQQQQQQLRSSLSQHATSSSRPSSSLMKMSGRNGIGNSVIVD